MKRRARRAMKSFRRKLNNVKSAATGLLERSTSQYDYPRHTSRVISTISARSSDDDDDDDNDLVFEETTDNDLQPNDNRRASATLIPCEFCNIQQPSTSLDRHQRGCTQNPIYIRRARHLRVNNTATSLRRRTVSDNVTTAPSAPRRSRSPSPTEDYPAPSNLVCPITLTLFRDPVVASDGHTYERSAIMNWLRDSQCSPITREKMSVNSLNPNRIIKKMADEFREECQRKRSLYKYKLDVDVKKLEEISYLKTNTKTFYQAEWIKEQTDSKIILQYLTGDRAEKIAQINCQIGSHPNIVQTFGRVEHTEAGILLVQEYLPRQTLFQLIKHTEKKLSITILDTIIYQIASALEHLASREITHGKIKRDSVFIYQFNEIPENISVKITNIGEVDSSKEEDIHAFGILAQELYSLKLLTDNQDLFERQNLIERCLASNPNERPTFDEVTKSISNFMSKPKYIYPPLSE